MCYSCFMVVVYCLAMVVDSDISSSSVFFIGNPFEWLLPVVVVCHDGGIVLHRGCGHMFYLRVLIPIFLLLFVSRVRCWWCTAFPCWLQAIELSKSYLLVANLAIMVDGNAATWFSNICLTLLICIKTNFPIKCGRT